MLQGINDDYFHDDQESSPEATNTASEIQLPVTSDPMSAPLQPGFLAVEGGPAQPLASLILVGADTFQAAY